MPSVSPRFQALLIGSALVAVALVLSGFGLSIVCSHAPVLEPIRRPDLPTRAWDRRWSTVPALSVQTSSPNLHRPRPISVRGVTDGTSFCLLLEWRDETPDLGFEGAYYTSWAKGERAMVQESTLLRDEVAVWLGPASSNGTQNQALRAERDHGHWVWSSQWQMDKDRNFIGNVRKEIGTPYVEYYPLEGDGAFAARYVGNTNAITSSDAACKWIVQASKDVYTPPVTRVLDGEGRWNDGRWRVLFEAPVSSLLAIGTKLELVMGITDGGLGERNSQHTFTEPLLLDLSSWARGKSR